LTNSYNKQESGGSSSNKRPKLHLIYDTPTITGGSAVIASTNPGASSALDGEWVINRTRMINPFLAIQYEIGVTVSIQ
jgi:hypothetical protein